MRLEGVVPSYQALFIHDLHELQGSSIPDIFGAQELHMYLADAGLIFFPEDLEDLELTIRRFDRLRRHGIEICMRPPPAAKCQGTIYFVNGKLKKGQSC